MTTTSLPSFSIILETENLANADLEGLSQALSSLVNQDVPPSQANEVILIDSGDTPATLLQQLCQRYPWIKVHPAPAGTGYYQAKMLGAQLATGEIVVYADSDCIYEPSWLRTILTTFNQGSQIQVVAGETTTRGAGPYGTAMALTYIFPQYSGENSLAACSHYFLNNVAFRRSFLLEHPIPTEMPLYRGNCAIHAHDLLNNSYTIWRQPNARATHAPPNGLSHFFWRFLLIGHDYYWQNQLLANQSAPTSKPTSPEGTAKDGTSGLAGKSQVFFERLRRMVRNNPRHLIYLPFAIPIVAASVLLIFTGHWITAYKSDFLLKTYDRILGEPI